MNNSDLKRNLYKYCENQYIDKLTTDASLLISELEDELNWIYDNSNEPHITSRAAKICPPENR